MRIRLSSFCWECLRLEGNTKEAYDRLIRSQPEQDILIEVNEDNAYEVTCPKGHKSMTSLQAEKFEILLDLASMALLDGYTREAVMSIASALERFYEYCIRVHCIHKGWSFNEIDTAWNQVKSQSERQFGAFWFLRFAETGKTPPAIPNTRTEFRNKVVHKGYIPNQEEALDYGDFVLRYMFDILLDMRVDMKDAMNKATIAHLIRTAKNIPAKVQRRGTAGIPTIVGLMSLPSKEFGTKTFREAVSSIQSNGFYSHFWKK